MIETMNNNPVLTAFQTMAPADPSVPPAVPGQARDFIIKQIIHFPSIALPDAQNPACIVGIIPMGGVAELWQYNGAGFRRQAPVILGMAQGLAAAMYEIFNLHRMEMRVRRGFEGGGLWARRIGFEYETTLKRAGSRGEDMDIYLWPHTTERGE